MLENIMTKRDCSVKTKVTVKSAVSAGLIVLAVVLPQIFHLAFGQSGGVTYLPMYLPILIGGCILGWKWGLAVGILSPVVSFLITSAFGNPMPVAARLPFMMAELAVFAVVSGQFSKKIAKNAWVAFPSVLLAAVCGRAFFMLLAVIFQSVAPFTPSMVWSQIQTGFIGLISQAVIVPFIVIGLKYLLDREKKND